MVTLCTDEHSDRELLRSVITLIGDYDPLSPTADVTQRYIPILEARGASDTDETDHRRDSTLIGRGVTDDAGFSAIVQYQDDVLGTDNELAAKCNDAVFRHLRERAKGVIVRNNPRTLCSAALAKLDRKLTELSESGVPVLSTPELIRSIGAKDTPIKIKRLQVGIQDTSVDITPEQLWEGLRTSIAFDGTVRKTNISSSNKNTTAIQNSENYLRILD
ncbi:ligase [Fragilaria crotonensis]|nr:ligase [Fragilaria crotonensis]